MEIELTYSQWEILVALVAQGNLAIKQLGLPVDVANGYQKIEIEASKVKITLND